MKPNIAVIYGGFSSEYKISIQSGKNIASLIDKNKFNVWEVLITKKNWMVNEKYPINKEDFTFLINTKKIHFDAAIIVIHGTPGEDGILQSYFELISLPYISCNPLASALTFNKFYCNYFLKSFGIDIAPSFIVRKNDNFEKIKKQVLTLGLPVFVKPNAGGSSFGTTKLKNINQLKDALYLAFNEANEVIIESFIKGREMTCGVLNINGKPKAMTPIEIISAHEFFDFEAKYNPKLNKEIIPAPIQEKYITKIKQTSEKIYNLLNCDGIVRIDYILSENGKLYFLELNSIPGMTEASIVPKMANYDKISLTDVYTTMLENIIKK